MTNTTTEKLGTKRPLISYRRVHLRIRKGSLQSRHASRESTTVRLYQPTSANEQKRIRPTRPHHLVENVEALIVDNFIHAIEETKIIRPRSCQAVRLLRASGKALHCRGRGKRKKMHGECSSALCPQDAPTSQERAAGVHLHSSAFSTRGRIYAEPTTGDGRSRALHRPCNKNILSRAVIRQSRMGCSCSHPSRTSLQRASTIAGGTQREKISSWPKLRSRRIRIAPPRYRSRSL